MANNETVAEIAKETKSIIDYGDGVLLSLDGKQVFSILCRIEAAHNRELSAEQKRCGEILRDQIAEVERAAEKVAAKDAEIEKLRFDIMTLKSEQRTAGEVIIEQTNKVMAKDAEIAELTAIVNAECRKCGECAKFGKDCTAGDIDGAEDHGACEKFVSKEVAELREYLKDAASLRCGECWFTAHEGKCPHSLDKDCVAITWRKASEGAKR